MIYLETLKQKRGIGYRKLSAWIAETTGRSISYRQIRRYCIEGASPKKEDRRAIEVAFKTDGWDGKRDLFSKLTDAELDTLKHTPKYTNKKQRYVFSRVCEQNGIHQTEIAEELGISRTTFDDAVKTADYEKSQPILRMVELWFCENHPNISTQNFWTKESKIMEGKRLFDITIERFGIKRPQAFLPRIEKKDIYSWPKIRDIEKQVRAEIESQGTVAIIGPSGCGKSTLVGSLIAQRYSNGGNVKIMQPRTVDMEKFTVRHALETMCLDAGTTLTGGSHERMARYTFDALCKLRDNELVRPVIVFEEAHLLTEKLIKVLKRLMEWESKAGEKVLGIVLLAQEEMALKMGPTTRQFWNRCHTIYFPSLRAGKSNRFIDGYIEHRLDRAGLDPTKVFDERGLRAISKFVAAQECAYPLMINNILVALLNAAASTSERPQITAETLEGVRG